MTPPFPEICKKDLVVTVPSMPKDLILENFLVSCIMGRYIHLHRWSGGGGGLAPPPRPLFLAADNFLQFTNKVLNYHLVTPLPDF